MESLWKFLALPFLGALIVKCLDYLLSECLDSRNITRDKADHLLKLLIPYGELISLYGSYRNIQGGTISPETKSLQLDNHLDKALKQLYKGIGVENLILKKIATIRLNETMESNLSYDLDSSGQLTRLFKELSINCMIKTDILIRESNKQIICPQKDYETLRTIIEEANESFRKTYKEIRKYKDITLWKYRKNKYCQF